MRAVYYVVICLSPLLLSMGCNCKSEASQSQGTLRIPADKNAAYYSTELHDGKLIIYSNFRSTQGELGYLKEIDSDLGKRGYKLVSGTLHLKSNTYGLEMYAEYIKE